VLKQEMLALKAGKLAEDGKKAAKNTRKDQWIFIMLRINA
jgi:hypothetical protein